MTVERLSPNAFFQSQWWTFDKYLIMQFQEDNVVVDASDAELQVREQQKESARESLNELAKHCNATSKKVSIPSPWSADWTNLTTLGSYLDTIR
jgi:hypothetical protein